MGTSRAAAEVGIPRGSAGRPQPKLAQQSERALPGRPGPPGDHQDGEGRPAPDRLRHTFALLRSSFPGRHDGDPIGVDLAGIADDLFGELAGPDRRTDQAPLPLEKRLPARQRVPRRPEPVVDRGEGAITGTLMAGRPCRETGRASGQRPGRPGPGRSRRSGGAHT